MENTLKVKEFIDLVGGELADSPSIKSGQKILVETPPACWGPMITPSIRSGHEVSKPVRIEDAEVGDSIALYIEKIKVKSNYAASGTGEGIEGRFDKDPTTNAICPHCNIKNPETKIVATGEEGIVCSLCGKSIMPQTISNGYTVAYNAKKTLGVSVPEEVANIIAEKVLSGEEKSVEGSKQHLTTLLSKTDIKGLITRVVPMIGNIGCIPNKKIPSSRNGGDMLHLLTSNEDFSDTLKDDLTDAHMDINSVCEGSIVISPVKVKGAGIYMGDVHSIQGNGEMAGHTLDVTAEVLVKVRLIKNLSLQGPIIIPPINEINYRFQPFTKEEYEDANELASLNNFSINNKLYPVQFIGSGINLNDAINNGVERIANLINMKTEEVLNRATVSGEVEIGRTSGLVYITIMLTEEQLDDVGLLELVKEQYPE